MEGCMHGCVIRINMHAIFWDLHMRRYMHVISMSMQMHMATNMEPFQKISIIYIIYSQNTGAQYFISMLALL